MPVYNNYIYYTYDHFNESADAAKVRSFYKNKEVALQQQVQKAEQQIQKVKNAAPKELVDIIDIITNDSEFFNVLFQKAGMSQGQEITDSSNAGLLRAYTKTIGGAGSYFNNKPATEKNLNEWFSMADQYSNRIVDLFQTLYLYIAGTPIQQSLLESMANGKMTRAETKRILRTLLSGNGTVKIPKNIQTNIEEYFPKIMKAISTLGSISKTGKKVSSADIKSVLTDTANAIAAGLNELSGMAGEIAGVWVAYNGDTEAFKAFGIADTKITAALTGSAQATQFTRDPLLTDLIKNAGSDKTGGRQQKGDIEYMFTKDTMSFSIGASVKQTSKRTLEKTGIHLWSTSFYNILSFSAAELDQGTLAGMVNIASAHTSKTIDSTIPLRSNFSETQARWEWNQVKNTIALYSLFYALTGENKNTKTENIYLIINNKPMLIKDIIKKIASEYGESAFVRLGWYTQMQRQQYTNLNTYKSNGSASPDRLEGLNRSVQTYNAVLASWKAQKDISVSLQMLNVL